jgi:hypothetical protein
VGKLNGGTASGFVVGRVKEPCERSMYETEEGRGRGNDDSGELGNSIDTREISAAVMARFGNYELPPQGRVGMIEDRLQVTMRNVSQIRVRQGARDKENWKQQASSQKRTRRETGRSERMLRVKRFVSR